MTLASKVNTAWGSSYPEQQQSTTETPVWSSGGNWNSPGWSPIDTSSSDDDYDGGSSNDDKDDDSYYHYGDVKYNNYDGGDDTDYSYSNKW